MALDTYTDIKNAVARWLNRDDLDDVLPDFVRLAEIKVFRTLRIPPFEYYVSDTIDSADDYLAVPENFIEVQSMTGVVGTRKFSINPGTKQQVLDSDNANEEYLFARLMDRFIYNVPETPFTVQMVYYGALTPLSGANESNWLTKEGPELLLFGALIESAVYVDMEPSRLALYQGKYQEAVEMIKAQVLDADYKGGTLTVHAI